MKSANTSRTTASHTHEDRKENRCQHHTPAGRRCKQPVEAPGKHFCYTHMLELKKSDVLNLKNALLTNYEGFQTAQGINSSLSNLYMLLANNYISPRRASVLAYINSLLLRTLPAIDADEAAGFTDPTAPPELATTPGPAPVDATSTVAAATDSSAQTPPAWDPSIPEPDPTKKPS